MRFVITFVVGVVAGAMAIIVVGYSYMTSLADRSRWAGKLLRVTGLEKLIARLPRRKN